MKHKLLHCSFGVLALLFVSSCAKHKGDIEEHIPDATINFITPDPSLVFKTGDSITVKAIAISTENIHGYDLIVKKQNDTTTCYFKHVHDHNDTLQIDHKWLNTISGAHNVDVAVKLYLDHNGHVLVKKAGFRVE